MTLRENVAAQNGSGELLRGALDQIDERGSLLRFIPDRARRLELMNALGQQGLAAWNRALVKYELTETGRQGLAAYRRLAEKPARAAGG